MFWGRSHDIESDIDIEWSLMKIIQIAHSNRFVQTQHIEISLFEMFEHNNLSYFTYK